jgi:ribosomal protein L32
MKRLFAAGLWLGSMAVVLIGSLIGIAALKPFALGFTVGFSVATYATFIFLARRAFPPERRKLRWWALAGIAVLGIAAFSWFLAFLFVGVAEVALVRLAVSKEDWLPFDAAELVQTEECPSCGERRLHGARLCRRCGHAFDASAQAT